MWRQGSSAYFAYEGAAAAFGQEQSVVAAESGRSTLEFSGWQKRSFLTVRWNDLLGFYSTDEHKNKANYPNDKVSQILLCGF